MYKDKRGLFRESVMINGKRKFFSGKTKRDVMLKIAKYNVKQERLMTVAGVADAWENEHWDRLRFGSYRTYAPCLRRAVAKFGDLPIDKIKPKDIQFWLKELGEKYAFKTVSNHKTIVTQIFDYAIVNMGIDMWNPCDRVKVPSGLRRSGRSSLSADERTAILSTTKDELQLAYLILFTGCRLGEALALQLQDIDFDRSEVHITKAIAFHGNRPVMQMPKTQNGIRTVPLLPPLRDRLLELNLKPDDFIVSGRDPLTKSMLYRRWDAFCKAKNISIDRHSIRHQYATTLYEAGIDAKTAQELLGHAQIATTMDIYTHISDEKRLKDFIRLASYIG